MKSIISSPLSRGGHLLESERRFVRRWISRWRGIDYLDAPIRRYDTLGRRPTSTKRKASLTRTNRNGTCCYRRKQGNNYTGVFCTDLDRGRDSCEPANTLVLKLSTFTFLDAPLPHAANLFATCKNKGKWVDDHPEWWDCAFSTVIIIAPLLHLFMMYCRQRQWEPVFPMPQDTIAVRRLLLAFFAVA